MTLPESPASQHQQAQVPTHQAPAVASPSSAPSGGSKSDENLTCQWTNCSEKFDTAEDLYNHLCDIHVGRKSTNNLCLTCAWGACRTTTVKRDHITSHIRVHVPLKPHKCEFCGKAFKRPQDLKKHVKTHADDSVLLRSPEPDGTGRRQSGVTGNMHGQYTTGVGMQPLAATAAQAYYGILHHGMAGIPSHGVPGLGSYYPNNAPQSSGGVYYYPHSSQTGQEVIAQAAQAAAAQAQAAQAAQAAQQQHQHHQEQQGAKKRSFDGVDQFFEDAKRHKIQPVYDGAMAQRLTALQFSAPSTTGEGIDFSGSATVTAPASNGGPQTYTLPSLRTKQDLIDADHFLTQLSANVYDSSGQQFQFRAQASQSPHTPNGQGPQSNQQHDGAPPAPMGQQNSGTAALTPPQSNYTTSHSPVNQSPQQVSPQTSTASMYPSLPTAVSSGEVGGGYSAPVSSAPASSLGTNFESNEARRYPVGVLRKAKEVGIEFEDAKDELSDSMIDPSLGALAEDQAEKTSHSEIINNLRSYIKELLQKEDEREKHGDDELQIKAEAMAAEAAEEEDHTMGDAPDAEQTEGDNKPTEEQTEEQTDAQALYPILKAVAAC